MSRLIVSNIETQNIKFDSDTTAFTIGSDGSIAGTGAHKTVIIANNTTGGTGLTEIAFDLSMDTSYAFQRVVVENLYSSAQNDMYARTRKASNNTYYTSGGEYAWAYRYVTSGGAAGSGSNGANYGRICGHGIGNADTETGNWIIDVYNNTASGTGKYTLIKWQRFGWHSTPHAVSEDGHIIENVTPDTTNQFKIYGSAGGQTLSYSGYVHYGFKRS